MRGAQIRNELYIPCVDIQISYTVVILSGLAWMKTQMHA